MPYTKNNEIQTRIALKYDTFENWTTLNPILLEGEVAFATVSVDSVAGYKNQPNIIIKVGDGVNHFNNLKTVSALAADVHTWAKNAEKPKYDANEIAYSDDKFVSANLQGVIAEIAAELENLTGGSSSAGSISSQITKAIEALDVALVEAGAGEVIGGIEEVDGKIVVSKKTLTKADIPTIEMTQVNGLDTAITEAETRANNYAKGLATNYDAAGSANTALDAAKSYADSLASNYDAAGSANTALTDAKAYADGLAKNYDAKGAADTAKTAAIQAAKDYADGLASNYDNAGSAAQALTDAKAYADGLAVNYDAKGTAASAADDALKAAKTYADGLADNYDKKGAAATAEANAKTYANSLADNYDPKNSAAQALTAAKAYADGLAEHYDVAGAASKALADAKKDAQERIDLFAAGLDYADTAVSGQFVTKVTEVDGIISVERATINAGDVVLDTEKYQNTNVATAMDDLKDYVTESSSSRVVSIVESDDTTDYAKVYTIKQGQNVVGSINIPKDLVLKTGHVTEDGYIVLVLNDKNSTEISIDAHNLIEYVTSGSNTGDMIVVSIDADHKVTASITDGTVTKTKLAPAVQASLGLADTALQKADITSGTANGTIAVEGSDVAVTGLHAIAFNGDVKNLTQTADTYVVFKCGSASVNI